MSSVSCLVLAGVSNGYSQPTPENNESDGKAHVKKLLAGLFSGLIAALLPACGGLKLKARKPGVSSALQLRDWVQNFYGDGL